MSNSPILTISILCSGRQETKKCLDSLNGLRAKVSNELILVDTGCDKEMRDLLRSYADKIIPFAWCDDFAKARNAGLEKAQGEWFLFIDDDEWFVDTVSIEDFFLSNEHKKYGSASYFVRNFSDREGMSYEDTWAVRLVSLQKKVIFKGRIHEIFCPLPGPMKMLPAIAEHFHYAFQTVEESQMHALRNRNLLEKAITEDNDDFRMWIHLAQEYFALEYYEKLEKFCQEALKKFEAWDEKDINRNRGCFYCGLIESKMHIGDDKGAKNVYKRALADKRNTDYCVARLMCYGAELWENENYKVEECCKIYLEIWEHYRKRWEDLFQQETVFVKLAFLPLFKNKMYSRQICLDLGRGNTASLKAYFDEFGWEGRLIYMTEDFMPCLVKAMATLPYEEIFSHAVKTLANKPGMDNFWEELEKIEEEEELSRLIRIFSEVTEELNSRAAAHLKELLRTKKQEEKKAAVSVEMKALAKQIKAQINLLLSQGMKQEALQVLNQLKSFMPDDEELEELEKQILE